MNSNHGITYHHHHYYYYHHNHHHNHNHNRPHDDTPRKFDDSFYNFISAGGHYSGCGATVWPEGYTIPWVNYTLHKGLMEDLLLYLFNNHSVLSCICAMKKSTFSRNKRRIAFTMEHSLAFFLVSFNTSLITVGMSKQMAVIINLFVISPTCSLYNSLFHDLLTCPCIQNSEYRKRNPNQTLILEYLGLTIAFPLMLGGLALLVLAALFTVAKNRGGILVTYVVQVQVYGAIMQLLKAVMNYITPDYHLAVHIGSDALNTILTTIHPYLDGYGCITLVETGGWYIEKVDKDNLKEGKDFLNFSRHYMFGLIQYEFICSKDYAIGRVKDASIKWKLIDNDDHNRDIDNDEDSRISSNDVKLTNINPLHH